MVIDREEITEVNEEIIRGLFDDIQTMTRYKESESSST